MTTTPAPLPWHATDDGPYTSERFVAIADVVRHALPSSTATPFNTISDVISMLVGQFGIAPAPEVCECGHGKDEHAALPTNTPYCLKSRAPQSPPACSCTCYRPATLDVLMARQGEELAEMYEAAQAAERQAQAWQQAAASSERRLAQEQAAHEETKRRLKFARMEGAADAHRQLREEIEEAHVTLGANHVTRGREVSLRERIGELAARADMADVQTAECRRLLQVADGYPLLDAVRRVVGERDEHKAKAELHQRAMESVCRGRDKAHDGWCKAAQERDAAREQARKAEQERDVAKEEIHQRREGMQVVLLERNRAEERARKADERAADLEQRLKAAEMSTWSYRTGTGGHASVNAPANKGAPGQPPPAPRSGARVYDFQGRDVGMLASIRPDGGLVMWESPAPRAIPLTRGGIGFEIAAAPNACPPSACGDMEAIEVVASGPLLAPPRPRFWMVWRDGAVEIITSSESVALSYAQQLARAHRGTAFYVLRAETEALHPVDPQPTLTRIR